MKPYYLEVLEQCYTRARKDAAIATGTPIEIFPEECPFTREQILQQDFLPKYSRSLRHDCLGGGRERECFFAENESWEMVCSMGQYLMLRKSHARSLHLVARTLDFRHQASFKAWVAARDSLATIGRCMLDCIKY